MNSKRETHGVAKMGKNGLLWLKLAIKTMGQTGPKGVSLGLGQVGYTVQMIVNTKNIPCWILKGQN